MQQYYDVTAICSGREHLAEIGEAEGVKVFPLELTRRITIGKDLKALIRLYRFLRKEKPLFVHTHTPKAGLIGMIAAYLAHVPYRMHTVAGLPLMEATGWKRKILLLTERVTYFCATHVYPNSKGLQQYIEEHNLCKKEKTGIIAQGSSNGIDTAFFSAAHFPDTKKEALRTNLGIKQTDFVYIFVGRIVKDKGIDELVSAFKKINREYPQTKLLLVGPFERELDPVSQETETEIQRNPSIILTGFQQDVRPYLAISDALVFPSYREGFPNVVMQAGAMGLPSIVTDINGCNEIVEEGKNGLIIPPKNSEALKHAMELLLNDIELRKKLQSNAREMITSRYEQQVVWDALLKEYKELEEFL